MKFTIFKLHFYFGALDNPLSIVAHANVRRHDGMHEKIEHPIDKWYGIDYNIHGFLVS